MINREQQIQIENLYFQINSPSIAEIAKLLKINYQEAVLYIRNNKYKFIKDIQTKNTLLYLLIVKNFTRQEISSNLKIKPETVTRLIKLYNINIDFREIRKTKNEQQIIKMYEKEPLSIGDMCRKVNLSYSIVHKVYTKNNFQKAKPKKKHLIVLTEESYNSILTDLIYSNLSLAKIADKHNVSRQRIYQIQKSNNIKRNEN